MGRRLRPPRLRVLLLTVALVATTLGVDAAPVPTSPDRPASAPLPFGLGPEPAQALYCATPNPAFTGWLTASSSSTAAITRITNEIVYAYISDVLDDWACTLYRRYSAVAWNLTPTGGRFNWGTIINSTSVPCNWVIGETNYLKANSTADCGDFDAEYAMPITLTAQRVYQSDIAHNSEGDLSYAHSDCSTTPYYGTEIGKGAEGFPVTFAPTSGTNRPGANCDAITLDNFSTTQVVTLDWEAPTPVMSAPTPGTTTSQVSTSYTVQWQATDNVAGFGGAYVWELRRRIAPATNGTCGTYVADTAPGSLVSGTAQTLQSQAQALATGNCYFWTLDATDQNSNWAPNSWSGYVLIDSSAPTPDFATPNEGTSTLQGSTSYSVAWTETQGGSGITARSLQRQRGTIVTGGTCAGVTFANDGSPSTAASPVNATGLLTGYCYRWVQTLTNGAGTPGASTSGSVLIDTGAPTVNFTTPDEGSTALQSSTSYSVAWTETQGGSGVASRSLQRQRGTIVTGGTCTGVSFANDGSPSTAASPVNATDLLSGYCYRWIQSLTNGVGTPGASTSGSVLVDTTTPAANFTTPDEGTTSLQSSTSYSVGWTETQGGSGVANRSLQRQRGTIVTAGTCAGVSFANDGSPSTAVSPVNATGLVTGNCYRWLQTLTSGAGTVGSASASGSVLVDTIPPTVDLTTPDEGTTALQGTTSYSVAWTEAQGGSGISARSLQRQRGTIITPGTCAGVTFANDGSPSTAASPVNATGLLSGYCYRWVQTLTNGAGTPGASTSGSVLVDTTAPTASFATPDEGTTTLQPATSYSVGWTESESGSGVASRSLQRQQAPYAAGACGTFANDGSAVTTVSPVAQGDLLVNTCYRWVQTLTDNVGNGLGSTSGVVVRDTTANIGQQWQHTFESWDLGGGDSLAVNVANGNLVLSHPVVSLPIRGSAASVSLVYNRHDPTAVLSPGAPGWRLNVSRRLQVNGDSTVTFTDADGAHYTFTNPQGSGTITYTRPPALYATLTRDTAATPDRFTLTYRDQSKDVFDELLTNQGLLVREEDRFGNGMSIAYTGGTDRITTITETAASRTISFTWDGSNRLSQIEDWAWIDGSGVVQTTATGSQRTYRLFYDGSDNLIGWADPLSTSGSCPTGGSHLTCIAYPTNGLDISKTQTVTTAGAQALSTTTRTITTKVAFSSSNVASVKDAQQVSDAGTGTTFTWESSTRVRVDRPATPPMSTAYVLVEQNDAYARIQSVFRDYPEGSVEIERRTTWHGTYPTEPASITDNYSAVLSTPARTVSYTYVASSLGLVERMTEPLTATDDRWTDYVYNANNDVTLKTVSLEGASPTVTRSCYSTQSQTCPTSETGLTLVRRIDNWVSGGAQDDDTNVTTDFEYDAYGRPARAIRHNRAPDGSVRDDRVDALIYDAGNLGNLEKEITNYVDGAVTNGTLDTTPGADSVRTDLTTVHTYDTAGNRVSTADPRRAIGLAIPATQDLTFTPSDDAYVRDASPSTNYGTDTTLQVRATDAALGAYEPFAQFTVTGFVGSISGAKLRLQNTATANASGRNLCVFRVPSTTWTEGAVTWATKPASDASSLACVVGDQPAGAIEFNLGTSITGPGQWAFRLTNDTTSAVIYASKEHTTLADPELIVTVAYGPLAADDYVTRWTYGALNERVSEKSPKTFGLSDQKTSTSTYDELGGVRLAVDFNGLLTTGTESDRAGRATKMFEDTDGGGSSAPATTSISTYGPNGSITTVKDRNQAGNSALGYTNHEYDSLGRLELATEAYGSSPDVESNTLAGYDGLDRPTLLSVGGIDTVMAYDLGGRVTTTDDDFTCATSTYDHRDLALTVTSGLAGGTCTSAANTRTVTNSFDGLGRQYRAEVTAGTGTGDRTQDDALDSAANRLTVASRKGGVTTTTTFSVTKLDGAVAEVRPDGSTSKTTFDPTGNPADKCYWKPGVTVGDCKVVGTPSWSNPPSQSTSATYDARNQRIQLVDGLTNGITTYDPDHNYQPWKVYLPTSSGRELQTVNEYDVRHRLIGITHELCVLSSPPTHACSSTTSVGSDAYSYDNNDNRTTVNESNGFASSDRRYCYDALDQLVYRNTGAACSSSAKDEANTYDDAANRLTALVGATTTNFAYTVDGQLCDVETAPTAASCSGGNITYDSAGRTTTYNGWTFAYDSEGRMLSACKSPTCASGSDKVEFAYDGESHRTQIKTTTAAGAVATRDFRYQSDAIVEEKLTDAGHPSGGVVRSYVIDDGGSTVKLEIASGEPDAGRYLVTWNGHGDALALWRENADGTLTLANSFTYETWGKPTTATHNGVGDLGFRFLYVGEFDVQWDDQFGLDLVYMHARHYSPALGRFLQPDPARAGSNPYGYVDNNPVTTIDPNGRCPWCIVVAIWVMRVASAVLAAAPTVQRIATTAPRVVPTVAQQAANLAHIIQRHTWSYAPKGASVFLKSVRWENLIQYGGHGKFETVLRYTNGNWTIVNTVKMNMTVGYEAMKGANGQYWYRATDLVTYVWKNGMLTTMYPGAPR